MLDLGTKETGDELLATEWDNHAFEMQSVVIETGGTLDSSTQQLVNAIDKLAKSVFYEVSTGGVGNAYVAVARDSITIESTISKGMIFTFKFNDNQDASPTLNMGSGAISLRNKDGSLLNNKYIWAGDILRFYYDGSNLICSEHLHYKSNIDDTFVVFLSSHATISPYISWDNSLGANPNFTQLVLRGARFGDILQFDMLMVCNADGFNTTATATSHVDINVMDLLKDNGVGNFDVVMHSNVTATMLGRWASDTLSTGWATLTGAVWQSGSTFSNKMVLAMIKSPWGWMNETVNSWSMNATCNIKIKDK
jgi:hypothetical protein